jgi:hypothetical protein
MKTLHNKIKFAIGVLVIAALAVSCIPKQESMGGAGQTLVKLFPSVYNLLPFDAITTPQTGILFEVRRDVNNKAALNTTTTVVLKYDADTAIMNKYNTVNGTSYVPLPDTLGTVSPAISGGALTLDFAAGEFSKTITISVPSAGKFDFSMHYALAFTIQSVSGTGILSKGTNDTILCEVLAKNKYDGVYTVTGSFTDYVYDAGGTAYTSDYPINIQLQTSGALSVNRYDADGGSYGYVFDGGTAAFGAWTPSFVFDGTTDDVIDVVNTSVDSPARGRSCVMYTGPGYINHYDAATKSMDIAFGMKQLNVTPQIRSLIIEHYVYKGPR